MAVAREGAEATAAIAACHVVLGRAPGRANRSVLWIGVTIGTIGSLVAIVGLVATGARLDQAGEDLAEGAMMLATSALLVPLFWYLAGAARDEPVAVGRLPLALGGVAVLLLLREAPETAIEIADRDGASALAALAGSATGVAFLGVAGVALALALGQLSWHRLALAVRLGLAVYVAGRLGHALSEFVEAGLVPDSRVLWDLESVVPQGHTVGRLLRALLGYASRMTLGEFLAWASGVATFVALEAFAVLRRRRRT
jgi:high-affinity Fe2+/Pb2+ permease